MVLIFSGLFKFFYLQQGSYSWECEPHKSAIIGKIAIISGGFPFFFNITQLIVNNSKKQFNLGSNAHSGILFSWFDSCFKKMGSCPRDRIDAKVPRYHGAGECRPGIRARQNSRGIIGALGRSQGSQR